MLLKRFLCVADMCQKAALPNQFLRSLNEVNCSPSDGLSVVRSQDPAEYSFDTKDCRCGKPSLH